MNKHFHNYTTQIRKVKGNYGNKKEAPAGGFFLQMCNLVSLILLLVFWIR